MTSCAEGVCLWRGVHLVHGANELRATADIGAVETSDSLRWTFAGSPSVVRIKAGDVSGYVTRDNERYGSDMYFVGGEGKGIDPPDTPAGKRSVVTGAQTRVCMIAIARGNFRITCLCRMDGGTGSQPVLLSRPRQRAESACSTWTSTESRC